MTPQYKVANFWLYRIVVIETLIVLFFCCYRNPNDFFFLHSAPLVSGVGECMTERRLGEYDASYYEHRIPPEGFTFHANIMGEAGIYGSFTERNPNPLTADFQTRGSGQIRWYISQPGESNRRRRQVGTEDPTVYLAIIALREGNSTINVSSGMGDNTAFSMFNCTHEAHCVGLCMLVQNCEGYILTVLKKAITYYRW